MTSLRMCVKTSFICSNMYHGVWGGANGTLISILSQQNALQLCPLEAQLAHPLLLSLPLLLSFSSLLKRNYSLRKNAVCDYLIQNKVLDVDNGLNQEHLFTEHLF